MCLCIDCLRGFCAPLALPLVGQRNLVTSIPLPPLAEFLFQAYTLEEPTSLAASCVFCGPTQQATIGVEAPVFYFRGRRICLP